MEPVDVTSSREGNERTSVSGQLEADGRASRDIKAPPRSVAWLKRRPGLVSKKW